VKEIFMLLLIVVLSAGCGRKQLLQTVEAEEVDETVVQTTPPAHVRFLSYSLGCGVLACSFVLQPYSPKLFLGVLYAVAVWLSYVSAYAI